MDRITIRPVPVGMLPRGQNYSVKDLGDTMQGYVNLLRQEIGVSRIDHPWTRFVQLHELEHVNSSHYSYRGLRKRLNKRGLPSGIVDQCINAAEDARVNRRLLRRVPDAHAGFGLPPRGAESLRTDACGVVAAHCTPDVVRDTIRKSAAEAGVDVAKIDRMLERAFSKGRDTISSVTLPLAQYLINEIADKRKPPKPPKPPEDGEGEGEGPEGEDTDERPEDGEDERDDEGHGDGPVSEDSEPTDDEGDGDKGDDEDEDKREGDGEDEDGDKGEDGDEESDDEGKRPDRTKGGDDFHDPEGEAEEEARDEEEMGSDEPDEPVISAGPPLIHEPKGEGGTWIIPKVVTPPLTHTVMRPGTHNQTASDTGHMLRDVCRIATDGKVFGRSLMRPGTIKRGTFLIDASGSMSLKPSDIESIIRAVPAAIVAIYSGDKTEGVERAWITVVAKDGKMVDPAKMGDTRVVPRGFGNMCDGPALLWLTRMPGPRFWYCDGGVTGTGDSGTFTLHEEAEAIVKVGRIRHINPMSLDSIKAGSHSKRPTYCEYKYGDWRITNHGAAVVAELRHHRYIR